ncbi:MAG: hypothetical protein ACXW30_03015 [Micavibrio sp.]
MLNRLTSKIVNQVIAPGSLFWKREKRALLRRWQRAMLLPETILLAGLIIISSAMVDHSTYRPGQQALASHSVLQDGVPTLGTKRKQRIIQERLQQTPENLLTLTANDLVNAFSYADLQRQEGEMVILQFRGNECVLDIYSSDGGKSTAHYEFRARELAAMEETGGKSAKIHPRACVSDILKSRRV